MRDDTVGERVEEVRDDTVGERVKELRDDTVRGESRRGERRYCRRRE